MQTKLMAARIGKGVMAINLALCVRVLRRGFRNLPARLSVAFNAIDPLDTAPNRFLKRIPEIELRRLVRSFSPLFVDSRYVCVEGSLPWVDLVTLLTIACDRRPKAVLEIGTFYGHTARLLALNLPDSVVHTIDLPLAFDRKADDVVLPKDDFHLIKGRQVGAAFQGDHSIANIVQHYGDTAIWDFSQVQDASVFFIDGSHTYEYARNDTEKCLAAANGRPCTLLWHDCDGGHRGVIRYLAELACSGYPVRRIAGTNLAVLDQK